MNAVVQSTSDAAPDLSSGAFLKPELQHLSEEERYPYYATAGVVASVDEHGYIRIADRTRDLIRSGGEWISSVDMETLTFAKRQLPERFELADAIPRTSTGKSWKAKLREQFP